MSRRTKAPEFPGLFSLQTKLWWPVLRWLTEPGYLFPFAASVSARAMGRTFGAPPLFDGCRTSVPCQNHSDLGPPSFRSVLAKGGEPIPVLSKTLRSGCPTLVRVLCGQDGS